MFGQRSRKRGGAAMPYPFTPPVARTGYTQSPHFGNASALNVSISAAGMTQRHWTSDDSRATSETVAKFPAKVRAILSRHGGHVHTRCSASVDSATGLAWLVASGSPGSPHSLHVWQSHQVDDATLEVEYHMDGWCRELQLPASGGVLSRASNVCAVPGTGAPGSRPGLVAVMANGLVMFWPDVSKDIAKNATVAFASAIDRAHSVVSCNSAPHGCLMVTDQGQLFHISVRNPNGRPTLQCAPVSQGEGVLGWGRRLVFGRGDDADAVQSVIARSSPIDRVENEVAVLTAQKLQVWEVHPSHERPTELVWSVDLLDSSHYAVQAELGAVLDDHGYRGCQIALLDAAYVQSGVMVLAACLTGGNHTDDSLLVGCGSDGEEWTWHVAKSEGHGRVKSRDELGQWRLLVAPAAGDVGAWIVDGSTTRVFPTTCRPSDRPPVALACETACPEPRPALGGHAVGRDTVILSDWSGGCIIRVTQQDVVAAAAATASADEGAAATGPGAADAPARVAAGGVGMVRGAAPPAHNAGRLRRALEKYRSGDPSAPLFSVELDNLDSGSVQAAAQLLSREIADERKADPRWAEDESRSNSAMTSHIVQTQLQAKLELHNLLIKLLLEWTHRGGTMWHSLDEATRREICNHGEMLAAAASIRELHTSGSSEARSLGPRGAEEKRANRDLLDRAMQETQHNRMARKGPLPQHLAPTQLIELFYQDVSHLGDENDAGFAAGLLAITEVEATASADWPTKRRLLWLAADVLIAMSRRVGEYRAQNAVRYSTSFRDEDEKLASFQRLGWTSQPSFRAAIAKLFDVITEYRGACPPEDSSALLDRLYLLGDALLAGFHPTDQTPEATERDFVAVRETVLAPFAAPGCARKDLAPRLATQYHDYRTLVRICERDGESLDRYEERFGEPFAKAKFQHFIDRHEPAKLLGQPQTAESARWLSDFLVPHPDLHWLERIRVGRQADFAQAAEDLDGLAFDEALDVDREVTLRSIARLCLLAAGDEEGQEAQFERLVMLEAQRTIPTEVLDAVGPPKFTSAKVPPLERSEIIDLLVGNHDRIDTMPTTQPAASERLVSALKLVVQDDADDAAKVQTLIRVASCAVHHDAERWREMADQLEPEDALADTLLATALRLAVDENLGPFVASLLEPAVFQDLCTAAASLCGGPPSANFDRHLGIAIERAVPAEEL